MIDKQKDCGREAHCLTKRAWPVVKLAYQASAQHRHKHSRGPAVNWGSDTPVQIKETALINVERAQGTTGRGCKERTV